MPDPGKLDQRVRFESESRLADGAGGASVTWTPVVTVSADVEPLSGREQPEAMQLEASALYRVTIRNRSDLDSSMRLVWTTNGDAVLNVRDMPDPGRRALYREIMAEAGVAV